ncbi:MAG: hypothetical protein ACLQQ4_18930 [Bacteroidia bacterium]
METTNSADSGEIKNPGAPVADGSDELTTDPRILEIAIWIEEGESYGAIVKEFSYQWCVSERTVKRYIAVAKEVVGERIRNGISLQDEVRRQLIEEEVKRKLPVTGEIEKMLWEIAKGEIEIEKQVNTKEGLKTIYCKPGDNVRLQALDKIWKIRGKNPAWGRGESSLIEALVKNEERKKKLDERLNSLKTVIPISGSAAPSTAPIPPEAAEKALVSNSVI